MKESEWFILSLNITVSVIAYIFLYYAVYYSNSPLANLYVSFCSVAVIVINITMYIVLSNFSNRYETEMENSLLKKQTEYQEEAIKETKRQFEELRKVRHDFNNTLYIIKSLNEEGKIGEAAEYIQNYINAQTSSTPLVKTGNSFVDAIVNTKLSDAVDLGINTSFYCVNNLDPSPNIDLCSVLGNALDNAVSGAKRSSQKNLRLEISRDREMLTICIKNSIDSSVLENNPNLVSSKSDKNWHGYGTKIIREVAEKNSGFADFYEEDGFFCCNIVMSV